MTMMHHVWLNATIGWCNNLNNHYEQQSTTDDWTPTTHPSMQRWDDINATMGRRDNNNNNNNNNLYNNNQPYRFFKQEQGGHSLGGTGWGCSQPSIPLPTDFERDGVVVQT
jgi:hypothetical protein